MQTTQLQIDRELPAGACTLQVIGAAMDSVFARCERASPVQADAAARVRTIIRGPVEH